MDPYKIRVRVGDNEFDGEGPVETDYQQWLVVIANRATQEPLRNSERAETNGSTDKQTDGVDQKLLSEIFISDEATGEVSLRSLPPGENGNRAADAALLLMFGHSKIHGLAEVPVTQLLDGLRKSGLTVERFDRIISAHRGLFLKGGQKIGARYRLTNPGVQKAAQIVRTMLG